MKKILLLIALVLCFGLFAFAQEQPSQDQDNDTAAAPAGQPSAQTQTSQATGAEGSKASGKTVKGCLSGPDASGNYTLTSGKKTVAVASNDELKAHVGHEVKLTGTKAADGTFTATAVKHVSDTCTAAGGKHHKASTPDQDPGNSNPK